MKYIEGQCGVISELKECGEVGMQKHQIDPAAVNEAFKKSFSKNQDNTYLSKNKQILENSGVNRFPTVTLNNVKVKASLNVNLSNLG